MPDKAPFLMVESFAVKWMFTMFLILLAFNIRISDAFAASENPVNNIYEALKTLNLFTTGDVFDYRIDGLEPTYQRNCIRPYNNVNTLIPDQFCDSYKGAADKAVHFFFGHAKTQDEFTMHYQESLEFELKISLVGGSSIDLLDVGVLRASKESQWAFDYFKEVGVNAFIGTDKTFCYEVTFSDLYPMVPAFELKQRIMTAPLMYDPVFYTQLIYKIGTHIITGAKFGAAMAEVAFAAEKTMSASFSTDQSLEICAQENLWYVSATQKDSVHLSANAQTYNKIVGANYNLFYKGSAPTNGDQVKYNLDACADPQPISLTLSPILYMLTPDSFPEMPVANLSIIANNLMQGILDYCNYYTCYRTPVPTVAPWEPMVIVSGINRKKLIREDEGVCVLSEVRKLTYATCNLEIGAYEVGDAATYWYLQGSGRGSVVCSAICSKSIGWLKNKGSVLKPRTHAVSIRGGYEGAQTIALESSENTVCMLRRVDNEFVCNDYCAITNSNGVWNLKVHVGVCYDDKHMEDKDAHGCHAYCFDTTRKVDFNIMKAVNPRNGVVPIALANETFCMFAVQQLAGSHLSDTSAGGGCILSQGEVPGREGVYWRLQAVRPNVDVPAEWCYDNCNVMCASLF